MFSYQKGLCQDDSELNQEVVDDLKQEYKTTFNKKDIIILLAQIVQNETNPEEKLFYAQTLIEEAGSSANNRLFKKEVVLDYRIIGFLQKGNALQLKGEFHEAIEAFSKCNELAIENKDFKFSGTLLRSIADTYSMLGNSESAEKYYDEAITYSRSINDEIGLASALLNAGDEYYKTGQYDKALLNFAESGKLFELLDYPVGKAYNKGNTGMVYAEQGKHDLAKENINAAIKILEEVEDYYPISVFLNSMSDIYVAQKDYDAAFNYTNRSLKLAERYHLKDQISDANLQLSQLLERSGNTSEALGRYKTHIIYRDSVVNLENVEKSMNFEVAKRELEAENAENETAKGILREENLLQKGKTNRIILLATVGVLFLIGLLAFGLFKRNKFVRATNKIITLERERSDKLLLNILPEETAQELKDNGRVKAKKYPSTTVLFSDFKGFTSYAENLSPEKLVETIDHYFSKFDLIMEKYGLEKIKTIGDAYMAVGGLSLDSIDQAKEMVLAAKEMNDFVANAKLDDITTAAFDIRIGINTGPVVAGVVGTKKFAYDIWGDAVNIASRMESNSEAGRINISENTYQIVKSEFDCEYRGEIEVKNRGYMKMYFVNC
ncbi:adenylate/guanylate cyclase domain-containing protein [Winogradskyella sp. UBA3174]|uniref:adenylate/guanylate cyclase domain-containing protein n=1 Tax=Winogradskyella sp. UBA3174 TaxID=1947785 RepID=UPI0025ED879E|nr:adenylate/guanylate cyclase domain-containing protein [Winogradskyella sp. UBA3174]